MEVELSSWFKKAFNRLHPHIQEKAVRRMRIFKDSRGRDPRLEVHKLTGDKREEWAYSVDDSYRIAFIFISGDMILYTDIGTHDIYKK